MFTILTGLLSLLLLFAFWGKKGTPDQKVQTINKKGYSYNPGRFSKKGSLYCPADNAHSKRRRCLEVLSHVSLAEV